MPDFPTTVAAFPTRCEVCDEQIEEGDEIGLVEEDGIWVHVECVHDA